MQDAAFEFNRFPLRVKLSYLPPLESEYLYKDILSWIGHVNQPC